MGPHSDRTGPGYTEEREGKPGAGTKRKKRPWEDTVRRQSLACQERDVSSEINPAGTLILDFHAPEL